MNATAIRVVLDAHDALVRDCAEGRSTFGEFLAAYGDFPRGYSFEQERGTADERDVLRMFGKRVAFHRRVASVVAGLRVTADAGSLTGEIAAFIPMAGLMRLREIVARYPKLEVARGSMESDGVTARIGYRAKPGV